MENYSLIENHPNPFTDRVHLRLVKISAPSCFCYGRYCRNPLLLKRLLASTEVLQEKRQGVGSWNEEARKPLPSRFVLPHMQLDHL